MTGVAETVIGCGEAVPPSDIECPLMSLPAVFATALDSIPAALPYLRADPVRSALWRDRLGTGGEPKVGVVWAGNPNFRHDRRRSPGLAALRSIFDLPGIRFFGLQMAEGRRDLEKIAMPESFRDLGGDIVDFADTAAIMDNLDLVISSCTAPAHLAGALARPVWILLPHAPDWRWLLDRDDSPWYPTARLFRQPAPGDWRSVAERVAAAMAVWRDGV